MRDSRLNTLAALGIILVFSVGAATLVVRAINGIDWAYTEMGDVIPSV